MKFDISIVISVLAILVMFYCLWLVLSLRKNVPGGVVGSTWKTLTALVILFTLALVTPSLACSADPREHHRVAHLPVRRSTS
jgi:steroid 5-alpha reductase family enzyme